MGAKQSLYQEDQLDDEALQMIMHPIRQNKVEVKPLSQSEKKTMKGTIFDAVYPNCLCFSDGGKLFVGDSRGTISACEV